MNASKLFRVAPGARVRLASMDPGATAEFKDRSAAEAIVASNVKRMAELSQLMWAENKRALLIVLQGMDTSGKDGTVRHVLSGVDPTGCRVHAFKQPSAHELDHDYLWRVHEHCPGRGEMAVFNRSHYEDVIVVPVHGLIDAATTKVRYRQINDFERHLAENGTMILKFFLHISKDEQLERLRERLEDPAKNWKFAASDVTERRRWPKYQRAYEAAISATSTAWAPWFVIPANRKWFRNLAVSQVIVETLAAVKMAYPKPTEDLSRIRLV